MQTVLKRLGACSKLAKAAKHRLCCTAGTVQVCTALQRRQREQTGQRRRACTTAFHLPSGALNTTSFASSRTIGLLVGTICRHVRYAGEQHELEGLLGAALPVPDNVQCAPHE